MPTPRPLSPPTPPDTLALLRGVSRSFYLSIRLLPPALRAPIGLAYLLARATDTIADTTDLPTAERLQRLQALAGAIGGHEDATGLAELIATFAPRQSDLQERALIETLPACLDALRTAGPADREDIRWVLGLITKGQTLDVTRFGGQSMHALQTAAELDEYTYLVAGCVGEFWTRLCFRHAPGFADLPQQQMLQLARAYGCGLQLVNILRDIGADVAAGRCYLPQDELAAAGLAPQQIGEQPQRFAPVYAHWLAKAQEGLEAGMRYGNAVRSRRLRAASALPALLGTRTLALLQAGGARALSAKVKVPRAEVRSIVASLALTLASRGALRSQFRRLGAEAPAAGWDNPRT